MSLLYQRILSQFPQVGLRSAFAYGSCVYKQIGQAVGLNEMIDFMLIVDEPRQWHQANVNKHPSHYSWIKYGGVNFMLHQSPNVYFNTLIPMEHSLIKYGVISTAAFIDDLTHWTQLYVSGRLHKPVVWIREKLSDSDDIDPTDSDLLKCRKQNLEQAVSTALLLLPETFSEEELFLKICKISYNGDFRMIIGEDKSKVERIVWGHGHDFRRLYSPILNEIPQVDWKSAYSDLLMRDCSLEGQKILAQKIPLNVLKSIQMRNNLEPGPDLSLVDRLVEQRQFSVILEDSLKSIVRKSSINQTLCNFLTAGIIKSIKYGSRKLWKMIGSNKI